MYLDYSKLEFDANGIPETPELVLKTMSEETIGVIPGVNNLTINVKFSEPSEITFDVPAVIDGEPNWIYEHLSGHKIIYTKHYGIYLLMNPSIEADGIAENKHIKAYSIEKILDTKKFFLEEGTFKFYDPTNPLNGDTIIGHILEIATGWKIGYISPSVSQRYRTFDQYDDYLLSFIYNTAPEKFRCVFVFDPYDRSISAYDMDEKLDTIPIYLDFDNLLSSADIEEISDELVTAIRPYGADELDIRNVNPTGTNWIYDISYFIENGDIPDALADKWVSWQRSVLNNRERFKGLSALRASATLNLLASNSALLDLQNELQGLEEQQSITIQALAEETTDDGKKAMQEQLDDINAKIKNKQSEIGAKQAEIDSISDSLNPDTEGSYTQQINAIVAELNISNYFTSDEYKTLSPYFIEQDITEDSFVATDIDTGVSGQSYPLTNESVSIVGSQISQIDMSDFGKTMYTLTGGQFSFYGSLVISGDVIRGTLETKNTGEYVLSIYAGSISAGNSSSSSGCITVSGSLENFMSDIIPVTVGEITTLEGGEIEFTSASGSLYLTANVSEYKKYSVELELYDYAADVLRDMATPTYEFSVDSGNFIFANEFAPFRNKLELGKGVYLNICDKKVITPYIIEFELEFEDRSNFSIVFSNRFKRHDTVNTLKDMIEKSYSSGRSFDASKYLYNQVANQSAAVTQFMNSALDAAKNTILAAANQSVIINGSGIHIKNPDNPNLQMRLTNGMLAITDDAWGHAKLAIGLFNSEQIGTHFGVNAETIMGKLIVGNNAIIENETDNGVMQFKVDSSGAWLNNSTFVLQKDNGGKILIDPRYGIVAGNKDIYQTDGTTVYPSFIDNNGKIMFDDVGMPDGSNFYLDITNGDAYFRGKLLATSGDIGGFTIEDDYLYSSSASGFVALNGSKTNDNSLYAIWVGAENPESAPFWVKKNGEMKATNATFSGTINASKLAGDLVADDDTDGWLRGCGISVGGNYKTGQGNFYVDTNGNVVMNGSINLTGNITWGKSNSPVRVLYARTKLAVPTNPYSSYPSSNASGWHTYFNGTYDFYASYSYDGGQTWTDAILIQGKNGQNGSNGSDASVTRSNIVRALLDANPNDGIYTTGSGSRTYLAIRASGIEAGDIWAGGYDGSGGVSLTGDYGGFCMGTGSTGTTTTTGAKMYGSSGRYGSEYFIVTNYGCRMTSSDADFYVSGSSIVASDEISTPSDRRIKNSVEYDMEKYENFFMSLKPTQYKMNKGTSGRYHIGFIAQDVENALLDNGLTTNDFAGITIEKLDDGFVKNDIESEYYQLRYAEFISLNTHMIQTLCRRIDDLENKIQNYESKEHK